MIERTDRRDDDVLVMAAQRGDADAFDALVRRHLTPVYAHALRFFGEPSAADDAVQEVFVKVYRSLGAFDGRSSFSTWLYRVTRNVCLDMFRQGRRRPLPVDPVEAHTGVSGDFSATLVDTIAVESAMRSLAPEDRDALDAVTLFGLTYEEAGRALNVPTGTVKSRVFRARRTILGLLGVGGDL